MLLIQRLKVLTRDGGVCFLLPTIALVKNSERPFNLALDWVDKELENR